MFKKYDQNQQIMFFQSLQDFVPDWHIARIIKEIDRILKECVAIDVTEEEK